MSKKVILGLIVLICFVVVASGCTSSNNETMSDSNDSSSGDSSSDSNMQVRVNYPGSWSGNIGDSGDIQTVEGTGTKTFKVDGSADVIVASFSKEDMESGTLTVEVLENGKVIESQSTSGLGKAKVRMINDENGWRTY